MKILLINLIRYKFQLDRLDLEQKYDQMRIKEQEFFENTYFNLITIAKKCI